ncbi:hypothetical protein [Kribbella caucasensis]|uniref:hypothetical protein n=1 Tax=Kribbella caucasensis TaxID=2512215 RepID=UPI00105B608F|nr:hypothetical protein [Kribbella sp. VKM Ac-2527]
MIVRFGGELPKWLVERRMQLNVSGSAEPADGDERVGEGDVVPGQSDEPLERLPEHQEQDGDRSVSDRHVGAVDVLVDRLGLRLSVELGACTAAMRRESKVRIDESGLDGPTQESAGDTTCGGPTRLPGIQVALA